MTKSSTNKESSKRELRLPSLKLRTDKLLVIFLILQVVTFVGYITYAYSQTETTAQFDNIVNKTPLVKLFRGNKFQVSYNPEGFDVDTELDFSIKTTRVYEYVGFIHSIEVDGNLVNLEIRKADAEPALLSMNIDSLILCENHNCSTELEVEDIQVADRVSLYTVHADDDETASRYYLNLITPDEK